MPNEVSLIFIAKRVLKLAFFKDHVASGYSFKEFIYQAIDVTDKMEKTMTIKFPLEKTSQSPFKGL